MPSQPRRLPPAREGRLVRTRECQEAPTGASARTLLNSNCSNSNLLNYFIFFLRTRSTRFILAPNHRSGDHDAAAVIRAPVGRYPASRRDRALLVIAALAAFLRKAGEESGVRALYVGAASAVLASIVAAALFQIFLNGAHDDRVEALVMVAAAALMFYMSGWLFLRQDGRAWTAELKRTASRALDSGARWSLGAIAFLAVFREGAETVLFLHALGMSEGGWNLSHTLGLAGPRCSWSGCSWR